MDINGLKELQARIIEKSKKCNLIGGAIVVSIAIITLIINIINKAYFGFAFFIFFELVFGFVIVLIVKSVIIGKDTRTFKKEFKNIFVLNALKSTFEDLVYEPEKGITEDEIRQIGMLNTADRFRSNDYISGTYKGIKFEQSDIHIEEEHKDTDSEGRTTTTWVTIFMGRWMNFDFNKKFKANIQVVSSRFPARSLPWGKKFSKTKMEDIEFNNMFKVYSEMEHDVFYILTPHFMERMKKLYNELNGSIMFCFVDNRLHVAINNTKDSFEWNPLKPINEEEIKNSIIKDIKLITDFVNELNLDNDLFKGGEV